ncbi:hypothetical protein A4A49_37274 [Nicotiana attenuata]|uniref:Uncharacterized protein n=1 Tax=Nicotiana attenuata TaxID=49451 RepID=A0A1J6KN80_NICAT|nr:hypothetical protein A4A49_37274 [Nicotiana attenuata]
MPLMSINGVLGEEDHIHKYTPKAHEGNLIKELLDKNWNVHANLMENWWQLDGKNKKKSQAIHFRQH